MDSPQGIQMKRTKQRCPRILFLSRPLLPPWDDVNKNLAYLLCEHIKHFQIDVVGECGIHNSCVLPALPSRRISWSVGFRMRILSTFAARVMNYDLVHFFLMPRQYARCILQAICALARVKVVQNLYGEPLRGEKPARILFADSVVVFSKYREKQLKLGGVPQVTCIWPGIDPLRFNEQRNGSYFRKLWNIEKECVLLFAGHYRNLQDFRILLTALKELVQAAIQVKLVMACRIRKKDFFPSVEKDERSQQQQVKRMVEDLGLGSHVVFMETVTDMPGLIAASDICVFPITEIGEKADAPMVILESMAMGKPVLMTSLFPYAEAIEGGGGICVPIEKPNEFASALKHLIVNKDLRRKIGEEGIRAVRTSFDIRIIAQEYEDLYDRLLTLY